MGLLILEWELKPGQRQTFTTADEQQTVIGRLPEHCHIVLAFNTVSRRHALIKGSPAGFEVINLSETNPVFVNGTTRLRTGEAASLSNNDTLRVGPVEFRALLTNRGRGLRLRCQRCDTISEYQPKGFCPVCGKALADAVTYYP